MSKGPIVKKLKQIEIQLNSDNLAKKGADFLRKITPIDSGNARRKTYADGSDIVANYPYAQRLDNGWSKQNTTGMIEPTLDYLADLVKQGVK